MPQNPETPGRLFKASIGALIAMGSLTVGSQIPNQEVPETLTAQSVGEPIIIHLPPDCLHISLSPVCESTTTTTPTTIEVSTTIAEPSTTTSVIPPTPTTEASLPAPEQQEEAEPEGPPPNLDSQHVAWMQEGGVAESDYEYVDDIFGHESTWRPDSVNAGGCIGLGQNCPDPDGYYWLKEDCPDWANEPVCQVRSFTGYMLRRYGTWAAASAYRKRHNSW